MAILFTEFFFYRVFVEFVLPSDARLGVAPSVTELYRVFNGCYRVLPGFTGFGVDILAGSFAPLGRGDHLSPGQREGSSPGRPDK